MAMETRALPNRDTTMFQGSLLGVCREPRGHVRVGVGLLDRLFGSEVRWDRSQLLVWEMGESFVWQGHVIFIWLESADSGLSNEIQKVSFGAILSSKVGSGCGC